MNCGEDLSHNSNRIEARLRSGTDRPRANSKLKSPECSGPVLGLILLRYADHKFTAAEEERVGNTTGRPKIGPSDDQEKGILYLPDGARFSYLLWLPSRRHANPSGTATGAARYCRTTPLDGHFAGVR